MASSDRMAMLPSAPPPRRVSAAVALVSPPPTNKKSTKATCAKGTVLCSAQGGRARALGIVYHATKLSGEAPPVPLRFATLSSRRMHDLYLGHAHARLHAADRRQALGRQNSAHAVRLSVADRHGNAQGWQSLARRRGCLGLEIRATAKPAANNAGDAGRQRDLTGRAQANDRRSFVPNAGVRRRRR